MENFKKGYMMFEIVAWVFMGIVVVIVALDFVFGAITKEELINFLSYKFFYYIILMEVLKLIALRITRESHTLLAYHFTLMVMMGFGREIVLLQVFKIEIILGFLISCLALLITYYISHILCKKSNVKTWFFIGNSLEIESFFLDFYKNIWSNKKEFSYKSSSQSKDEVNSSKPVEDTKDRIVNAIKEHQNALKSFKKVE